MGSFTEIIKITLSTVIPIVAALFIIKLIGNRTGNDFSKKDYYRMRRTENGFIIDPYPSIGLHTSSNDRYKFCYLRKEPFEIEVYSGSVLALNGKLFRATAIVSVYLPAEKASAVAEMFSERNYCKINCDEEINDALSTVLTEGLDIVLKEYNGESSYESVHNAYKAKALEMAMIYGHLVSSVPSFNMTEVK